jgi:hypothetical protein
VRNSRNADDHTASPSWLIPDAVWEFVGYGPPVTALPAPAPSAQQPDIRLEA